MPREISIICTHDFRELIQRHSKYEKDLGRIYTMRSESALKVDIKDPVVAEYYKKHSELIYRVGRIGAITFYTNNSLPDGVVVVLYNGVIHEKEYMSAEVASNVERYLYTLVQSAEHGEATID